MEMYSFLLRNALCSLSIAWSPGGNIEYHALALDFRLQTVGFWLLIFSHSSCLKKVDNVWEKKSEIPRETEQ